MGVGCLDECRNLKEFKSKSRTWVKENISVKPVRSEKSMRFGQRTTRNSQVREALIEEKNQRASKTNYRFFPQEMKQDSIRGI